MIGLPLLHPAVILSATEEGYVAYNTATDRFHELNPVAALFVELCNGERTFADLIELASPYLPANSSSAVESWMEEAFEQGLLCDASENNTRESNELTTDQLIRLAEELRDDGKVHAAFLCQQRATELNPTDPNQLKILGELAHILGRREEAASAYEACLNLEPDDAEVQHLLTSLRDRAAPPRVPDDCIRQLYKRFSSFYETNMCGELGYEGPQHLAQAITSSLGDRTNIDALDLGCGTGLAGVAVKERCDRLIGIDLSPEMIDQARERKIYEKLEVAEVTAWLETNQTLFDLIMACDTLIYFGDLASVLKLAKQSLQPNGIIAFSVEESIAPGFSLTDNGRYVHHPDYLQKAAAEAGLTTIDVSRQFLRMEYGQEVYGLFVTLRSE